MTDIYNKLLQWLISGVLIFARTDTQTDYKHLLRSSQQAHNRHSESTRRTVVSANVRYVAPSRVFSATYHWWWERRAPRVCHRRMEHILRGTHREWFRLTTSRLACLLSTIHSLSLKRTVNATFYHQRTMSHRNTELRWIQMKLHSEP